MDLLPIAAILVALHHKGLKTTFEPFITACKTTFFN